jgi:hypothetical protein
MMPFPPDAKPSREVTFAEHVLKSHDPGQTNEDGNKAAFRVARVATKDA